MTIAYLGLGGNLSNPEITISHAIKVLSNHKSVILIAASSFYRSSPIKAPGNDYINCVISIEWKRDPVSLLKLCLKIEKKFGRKRSIKNAPRTLDIDLLLFGSENIKIKDLLNIPHPQMTKRAFVLIPLLELNPNVDIPEKGKAQYFLERVSNQMISKITTTN